MTRDPEIVQPSARHPFWAPTAPIAPNISLIPSVGAVWGGETGLPGTGKVRSKNWEGLGRKNRMSRDKRS